jgi:hypothetical protein
MSAEVEAIKENIFSFLNRYSLFDIRNSKSHIFAALFKKIIHVYNRNQGQNRSDYRPRN